MAFLIIFGTQIARFKRQKAAESKLLEIRERKERRGRSTRASALSTSVESGEEDFDDDDGEEEREVCYLISSSLLFSNSTHFTLLLKYKILIKMLGMLNVDDSWTLLLYFGFCLSFFCLICLYFLIQRFSP